MSRRGRGARFVAVLLGELHGDARDAAEAVIARWAGMTVYIARPDRGELAQRRVRRAALQLASGASPAEAARCIAASFGVALRTAQVDVQRARRFQESLRTSVR